MAGAPRACGEEDWWGHPLSSLEYSISFWLSEGKGGCKLHRSSPMWMATEIHSQGSAHKTAYLESRSLCVLGKKNKRFVMHMYHILRIFKHSAWDSKMKTFIQPTSTVRSSYTSGAKPVTEAELR